MALMGIDTGRLVGSQFNLASKISGVEVVVLMLEELCGAGHHMVRQAIAIAIWSCCGWKNFTKRQAVAASGDGC